jgi:hypothetical protein
MHKKMTALFASLAVSATMLFTAGSATAAPSTPALAPIPVTGDFTDVLGGVGTFTGTFDLSSVAVQDGGLVAVGTLAGTLTDSAGAVIGTITQQVRLPLAPRGTCKILHLELGPLDLDLLGLVVHLDRVVLDITAQSGPGRLLGNLLCSIAHLLDGNGALDVIAGLLNRLIDILG